LIPYIFSVALILLTAIYVRYIEPNWLQCRFVPVVIKDLPESFDGYRIALLSDFHYPRWTTASFIRKAIAYTNTFDADLLAVSGDLCDRKRRAPKEAPNLSGLFDHAKAPDGIVGVLGNHDHWLDAPGIRCELANRTPLRLIENTSLYIARGKDRICIGGVGDLWRGVVTPDLAFADVPPEIPRILLSHNPDVAEDVPASVRIDLQLSGHTHGGQVRIPFGPALHVPSRHGDKFSAGLVKGKHRWVYTTRGICSVRRVRFCCRPEVTCIILRRPA